MHLSEESVGCTCLRRVLDSGSHKSADENWITSADLNELLQSSLKLNDADTNPLTDKLSARMLPEPQEVSADDGGLIGATDCVQLCYSPEWPLSVILTDTTMNQYSRVFSFLLKMKHVSFVLRDIWLQFQGTRDSPRVRQLQIFRLEIQHFVSAMLNSVITQVLEVSLMHTVNLGCCTHPHSHSTHSVTQLLTPLILMHLL